MIKGTLQMWLSEGPWDAGLRGWGGDHPGLSGWALNVITRVLLRGRQRAMWLKRRGNLTKEAETGVTLLKMEEGATSHGMQAVIRSWKWWGNRASPQRLQKAHSRADTLISAQWNWFLTSDLQNSRRINLYCFKPQSVWSFVTAATRI